MNGAQPIPILITGAGSELAFSVLKACRRSAIPLRLVACDADGGALGLRWARTGYVVPRADRAPDKYIERLRQMVAKHGIRAIAPTADAELELLPHFKDEFAEAFGCAILVNDAETMALFGDKWSAHEWYVRMGFPAPRTVRANDVQPLHEFLARATYPVVVKPRRGGGSRALYLADDAAHVRRIMSIVPDAIVQEHVGSSDAEYTAGTVRTSADEVYAIVLRRTLKFGMTNTAQVVQDASMDAFCTQVIRGTKLTGVNNIQFRMTADGPCIIEINPRFSGTTGIRAALGFNEVEMLVRDCVLREPVDRPVIRAGRVMRYMHEYYEFENGCTSATQIGRAALVSEKRADRTAVHHTADPIDVTAEFMH